MKLVTLFAAAALAAVGADPTALVVDRGLPQANWNNAAGIAERSNVRWTLYEQGFVADEFRLGEPGEKRVVDRIRLWAAPGAKGIDPAALGDFYSKVQLFAGEYSLAEGSWRETMKASPKPIPPPKDCPADVWSAFPHALHGFATITSRVKYLIHKSGRKQFLRLNWQAFPRG